MGSEVGQVDLQATAFGVDFDLCVRFGAGAAVDRMAEIRALLPPGWRERTGAPAEFGFTVAVDGGHFSVTGTEVDVSLPWADATHALDAAIRAAISLHAPGLIFVHAGVVGTERGAIVLPGRSFAGKTTLVAALLRAGACYFSDEYAVIDAEGLVHPYPRRLSVRGPDGRSEVPAAELGGVVALGPAPVVGIAALRYEDGGAWPPHEGTPSSGAMALIDNAVPARSRSAETLRCATAAARGAWFLEGPRGDADEAASALLTRA